MENYLTLPSPKIGEGETAKYTVELENNFTIINRLNRPYSHKLTKSCLPIFQKKYGHKE